MSDRSDTLDKAKERTTLADEKTDPADERTVLARQRTLLAVERTVSAWIRTGIAAMAAGVGIARLLGAVQPAWITRATSKRDSQGEDSWLPRSVPDYGLTGPAASAAPGLPLLPAGIEPPRRHPSRGGQRTRLSSCVCLPRFRPAR
jgi:uncharacterized membrane protein YidH (DUF202 family)